MQSKFMQPTIQQPGKEKFILPKIVLGPCFSIKANATRPSSDFIRFRAFEPKTNKNRQPLFLRTEDFSSYNGPLRNASEKGEDHITFNLSETDSPALSEAVSMVERAVEQALCEDEIKGMSDEIRETLRSRKEVGTLVRRHEAEKNLFIDLDKECCCYDWTGSERLTLDKLRGGKYQLVIQLSTIYLGQECHLFGAYLQWKIIQIRYSSEPIQHYLSSVFLFETDQPNGNKCIDAPPPAKKKKTTSTQT